MILSKYRHLFQIAVTHKNPSLLVTLRDQDLPLPVEAVLLSPWVDLLHSPLPRVEADGKPDYLPSHDSCSDLQYPWSSLNADELDAILKNTKRRQESTDKLTLWRNKL